MKEEEWCLKREIIMHKIQGLKIIGIIAFTLSLLSFILSIIAFFKFKSYDYLGISFFWIFISLISLLLSRVSNNRVS